MREPKPVSRCSLRRCALLAFQSAEISASTGPLWAGMLKLGVRWKTVTWSASAAMTGIDWIADDPVPMTATLWPLKSTPSRGQLLVCQLLPWKVSMPGKLASFGTDRQPVAMTQ